MEYLSVQEISDRWNISKRRVQILCREGRVEGAKRIGNIWAVPENAKRPIDARTKNPIIKKRGYSIVRADLKILLKELYKKCGDNAILERDKKAYVLSLISGALCSAYMPKGQNEQEILRQIYEDISGGKLTYGLDKEMVSMAKRYIQKHKGDCEIESIISWAYQYSNKIMTASEFGHTQFFTEKYMISYLVKNMKNICSAEKILDPCSGGGNFLAECLELLCSNLHGKDAKANIIAAAKRLYGYDIDEAIAKVAVVNLRIKALAIMHKYGKDVSFGIWGQISPNIFCPAERDTFAGSLAKDNRLIRNVLTGELTERNRALRNADVVVTNPPFASVKGMLPEQKQFLKNNYPLAKCDTCVAFMEAIGGMLSPDGLCGIVSQNAWMHLQSFEKAREKFVSDYVFYHIVNLGSGAFFDLSGEKSNVSLLLFGKKTAEGEHSITVQNLSMDSLDKKIEKIEKKAERFQVIQNKLNGVNGFNLSEYSPVNLNDSSESHYSSVAVPMQGTSTGNSKELVGFFWNHFGEEEWVPVSNGGGYCRWEGLNNCVVKWGSDGEYIKRQKGSALRNVKYFGDTQLVFSDTGTAGLNVRLLLKNQIFIASGPGIRILNGNEYAHMAFLNSRLAANYVRTISPKLTIAAGYIGRIPIREELFTSSVLERKAKLCVELKRSHLKSRPNNLEYIPESGAVVSIDIVEEAWELLKRDLTNELLKLEMESQCDEWILQAYGLSEKEKEALKGQVGECAFNIQANQSVDISKLDNYFAKLLDDACMLKRARSSKSSLGCDGILEFASKDLNVNPAGLVEQICWKPDLMKTTIAKYRDLILHNRALDLLQYTVKGGIEAKTIDTGYIIESMNFFCGGKVDAGQWMARRFNAVHSGIFKGKPFLYFDSGEIKKYDR